MKVDPLEQLLIDIHHRQPEIRRRIEAGSLDAWYETDGFVFTIEALWRLFDGPGERDLAAFQKMLYRSSLNRQLREQRLEISIHRNTGKVRSNHYCLKAT